MKKEKKIKTKKETLFQVCIGMAFLAFLAAMVLYVLLLHMEKQAIVEEEKTTVWVFREEVQEQQILGSSQLEAILEERSLPSSLVPDNAVRVNDNVPAGKAKCKISAGTILTADLFGDENAFLKTYKQPVLVAVEVNEYAGVVGGVLRPGNYVDIYILKDGEEIGRYDNVLVGQVFDGSGMRIPGEDTEQPMTRFNVYLEKEQASEFYRLQQDAVIRTAMKVEK